MTAYEKQNWHHNGSSCCRPFGTCMLTCFCPCITYGRTRHRIKQDGDLKAYSCCNASCMAFTGITCLTGGTLTFILPMIQRGDMRAKYHLAGNGCKDCLCACCCSCCDLVQQDKEAKYWEEAKKSVNQQPQKHGGMEYKPQLQGQQYQAYQPAQYQPQH
ncbi:hypothetical protein K469DRAFT_702992 [Zopfia rhizophila CBS 207.26]|uniref:PLAC8-domain-containing protein n=1 Tax=Zopfia rhizophila CBS 207.26 TaxID=1314779 RepID=A0A6A6D9E7_9PEZI|nr:hypothetical protein K469DRAFT_702992 [Zopfia rhizophila CBS 207.26]